MRVTTAGEGAWSIGLGAARYDIALRDGQLRNSYFGAAAGLDPEPVREHANNRDNIACWRPEAAVFVGPRADSGAMGQGNACRCRGMVWR